MKRRAIAMSDDIGKWILSALVLVVAAPALPLTGGTSAAVAIGALFAIWGIDWEN